MEESIRMLVAVVAREVGLGLGLGVGAFSHPLALGVGLRLVGLVGLRLVGLVVELVAVLVPCKSTKHSHVYA